MAAKATKKVQSGKAKALKILASAPPQYKPSRATTAAYNDMTKAASAKSGYGKLVAKSIKNYNKMGVFNPKKSAMYQSAYGSLKQVYRNQGRQDMQNAVAAAAANTGGFGNSYGTTAGNQAFQAQLNALAAQVPTLYSSAASEHANRKADLANLIGLYQTQQQNSVNAAQMQLGYRQALDEQRYNNAVNRDNALRQLANIVYSRK